MSRRVASVLAAGLLAGGAFAQQPLPPDVQADRLVEAGRKAYADNNRDAARDRFQEVVSKFANTPAANSARYGLALTLVAAPNPDYAKAADLLQSPANDGNFPDRPAAAHLQGVCHRAAGLAAGDKKGADRFEKARQAFNTARDAAQNKKNPELAARARCDQAEMELRLNRPQDARNTAEPFTKDPALTQVKARKQGLYTHGLACFLLKDLPAAGRSLNQVAPFTDPAYGPHAEYLLGRVLQLSGEAAEAQVHYDAVLAGYEKLKKDAAEALKQPDRFRQNPAEKDRLEALTKKAPEYVAAAAFHGATVNYEAGKFADALPKFDGFARTYPDSPLAADAHLRAGMCLVQLKQYDDANKKLLPLVDLARLSDQALLWLGKAQVQKAAGVPGDGLKLGIDLLKQAANRAGQGGNDADGRARRHDALLELADARQSAKEFLAAAQGYEQLWNDGQALPARREELLARLAAAEGLAGRFDRSAQRCDEFVKRYPQSVLTPAVLLRGADNSLARAVEAEKAKARPEQLAERYSEAAAKFKEVADKFPEFERANAARFGHGVCAARTANLDEAVKALEAVPVPERTGELATAGYLLADCLIRQAPLTADDALGENQIREKLSNAVGHLEAFLGANPKAAEVPQALLKLGHCTKRLGATLADDNARRQTLERARATFEKLLKDHADTPAAALGRVEQAKVRTLLGDRGGAINDLRPFTQNDKLRADPAAPLAVLHLASLMREENRPGEAAQVLAEARSRYDAELQRDPARAEWAALLKYHHAVALLESNKPAEALPLFDQASQQADGKPVAAEAALRAGQARVAEAKKKLDAARDLVNQAGNDANKKPAALKARDRACELTREAADGMIRRASELHGKLPAHDARARLYYEAAWARRTVAEALGKDGANDLDQARTAYRGLVEQFKDLSLAVDARLELADTLSDSGDTAGAVKLLKDALEVEPGDKPAAPDTLDRVRLKLGVALAAGGDHAAAAALFEGVAANPKSPLVAQALYRAGEAYLAAGDAPKAVTKLAVFRDKPEFHNRDNVSDRALVRLGQAHLALKQLDPARRSFDALIQRFGAANPLAADARYGLGLASAAENKHDDAIKAFEAVAAATTREVGAQAQVQIGVSRIAQKKYAAAAAGLLAVPYANEAFPAVGHAARLEAARALALDNKPAEAAAVLKKLIADVPADGPVGKAAAERLKALTTK